MKFSGKIEDGTSNKPLNFGSKLLPCRRFALSECTLRAKICALRVLLVETVNTSECEQHFIKGTTVYCKDMYIKVKVASNSFVVIVPLDATSLSPPKDKDLVQLN